MRMMMVSEATEPHPAVTQGYFDAQRGHTACPYGDVHATVAWTTGYDKAAREGLALFPRFGTSGTIRRSR